MQSEEIISPAELELYEIEQNRIIEENKLKILSSANKFAAIMNTIKDISLELITTTNNTKRKVLMDYARLEQSTINLEKEKKLMEIYMKNTQEDYIEFNVGGVNVTTMKSNFDCCPSNFINKNRFIVI
jgi:hypothetical protein